MSNTDDLALNAIISEEGASVFAPFGIASIFVTSLILLLFDVLFPVETEASVSAVLSRAMQPVAVAYDQKKS